MKKLVPLTLLALLLSGCPDSKMPKPPPKVPQPKLMTDTFHGALALLPHGPAVAVSWQRRS
jgi:hypothetical protein